MTLATLTVHLRMDDCHTLKDKRGRLKPLLNRLHRQFNISVAEMDLQDVPNETIIACALIGSGRGHLEASLQIISRWIGANWPDGMVVDDRIEVLP